MRILIVCSKVFYNRINEYKEELERMGHTVLLPNCSDAPDTEAKYRGTEEHADWKKKMFMQSIDKINSSDALLLLNFDKNGQKNYIGGATFLELYEAFKANKKIYFVNDIPEGMLKDEIIAFKPLIIHDDLSLIK